MERNLRPHDGRIGHRYTDRMDQPAVSRVSVESLVKDPRNARKHDAKNLEAIASSLRRFGQQKPIVVGEDGVVIAGNGTLEAAQSLGWTHIDIVKSALRGSEATAYALADNRTAELAAWDERALAEQLSALALEDEELARATGFSDSDVAVLMNREVEEDEVPEPPTDPITKPGDLWLLGDHRLLCGDSTRAEDVARLLDGRKPAIMVTDPPYGVDYDPNWRNKRVRKDGRVIGGRAVGKVLNDDRADWRDAWMLFPGHIAYVWHGGLKAHIVAESLIACGLLPRAQIVWAKSILVIGRGDYHNQHEPCWYCIREGHTGDRTDDRTQSTLWQIDKPRSSETGHSTQKPLDCMARPMKNHAATEVYDPFLGSGTTLIAAEQLGRKCYGLEVHAPYCDVIVQRWERLTGKKAERVA